MGSIINNSNRLGVYLSMMLLLFSDQLISQETQTQKIYISKDGSEIIGILIDSTDQFITILNDKLGEIKIKSSDLVSSKLYIPTSPQNYIDPDDDDDEWFSPPVPSINFLNETAIGLKQGDLYYQNILLYGNKFGYGVTDHFSINAGFEWYSIVNEGHAPILLIAPKYTFSNPDAVFHFGIGSNILFNPNEFQNDWAGTIYAVSTIGDPDLNLTIGIGIAFFESYFSNTPAFQLGGVARLTKNFAFVLDGLSASYDSNDLESVGSAFIRFMTKKFNFDIGVVFEADLQYGIPMANFSMKL